MSHKKALETGNVRKALDIKLGNETKKGLKEGLLIEGEYERQIKGFVVNVALNDPKKIVECENASKYIYPPLKYSFRRTVRTVACILKAVRKFKMGRVNAKIREGLMTNIDLEKLKDLLQNSDTFQHCGISLEETLQPYQKVGDQD